MLNASDHSRKVRVGRMYFLHKGMGVLPEQLTLGFPVCGVPPPEHFLGHFFVYTIKCAETNAEIWGTDLKQSKE